MRTETTLPVLGTLADMPDWARRLVTEKTPYLASDPNFSIVENRYSDEWVQFFSRGFYYTANKSRQQIV